jgi:hypothetical protein
MGLVAQHRSGMPGFYPWFWFLQDPTMWNPHGPSLCTGTSGDSQSLFRQTKYNKPFSPHPASFAFCWLFLCKHCPTQDSKYHPSISSMLNSLLLLRTTVELTAVLVRVWGLGGGLQAMPSCWSQFEARPVHSSRDPKKTGQDRSMKAPGLKMQEFSLLDLGRRSQGSFSWCSSSFESIYTLLSSLK